MKNNPIIQLTNLTKHYSKKKAVDRLNLEIYPGEIFGLLGPNGAGKTTSILMMLGLTEPTSGTAYVCGYDATRNPLAVKKVVGYLPDNVGFYTDMTALENLVFIAQLNGMESSQAEQNAIELLSTVGLTEAMHKKTGTFSRGMKQRLGLAEVLIKKPQVVILDEPTLGIDPSGVQEFLRLIQTLSREQNLTVLMSSHHLHQVQQVCDRVGIFVDGKMIVEGPIETLAKQLQQQDGAKTTIALSNAQGQHPHFDEIIKNIPGYRTSHWENNTIHIETDNNRTATIVRALVYAGAEISSVQGSTYTLDDIYVKYFDQTKFLSLKNEPQHKTVQKAG